LCYFALPCWHIFVLSNNITGKKVMKIVANHNNEAAVVLTTLQGHLDQHGNIRTICRDKDWCIISDKGGILHEMKINRYNSQRARHRFINQTGKNVRFKWTINIVTNDGQILKYDFGDVSLKSGITKYSISVPYKYSQVLAQTSVKRIMVDLFIV
jgi:hypothetical protein